MNEVIDPRILEALEVDGLDISQVVLEESDIQAPSSLWPSIWTVRLPECMVFLWDFYNNGKIEVYAKTTHDGLCYPISSCVSCIEVVAQQQ